MANSEKVQPEFLPELPKEIIQSIFSLLETEKDQIRASCLSKSWLNAWQTRPILYFNEKNYYKQILGFRKRNGITCYCGERNPSTLFLDHVNHCLERYREENIGIDELKIVTCNPPFLNDEWIKVAGNNGVRNLQLHLPYNFGSVSTLPRTVFKVKSLLELSLIGYGLKLPKDIKCRNLKSLHLYSVSLNQSFLERITSSCQEIEDLKLDVCILNNNLDVIKGPKLKKFWYSPRPDDYNIVQVEAPNLEFLSCSYGLCGLSLSTSRNLKQLVLVRFDEILLHGFFSDLEYKFRNLEDLEIHCPQEIHYLPYNLGRIKILSSSLRKMVLKYINLLEQLHIDAPGLTRFEYWGNRTKVSFARFSSDCSSYIHWDEYEFINYVRLYEFLKSLSQTKIFLFIKETMIGGEILLANPFICDPQLVDELRLSIVPTKIYNWEKVLNGVFWACHPKIIRLCSESEEIMEKITKKLMMATRDDDSKCIIKFWEWSLKVVKLLKEKGGCVFELEWENS